VDPERSRRPGRRCPNCGSHVRAGERTCDVCGVALPWRLTLTGVAAESLVVVVVVLVAVAGLLWFRQRGGPLVSPEAHLPPVVDRLPTDIPTFTPGPASLPTQVPSTRVPLVATSVPEVVTHTVVSGDTLFGIAQRYAVSADAIMEANRDTLDSPNRLSIGQRLRIPVARPTSAPVAQVAAATAVEAASAPTAELTTIVGGAPTESTVAAPPAGAVTPTLRVTTHRVTAGETITTVASAYALTVGELVALNPTTLSGSPSRLPAGADLVVGATGVTTDSQLVGLTAPGAEGALAGSGELGGGLVPEGAVGERFAAPVLLAPGDRTTVSTRSLLLRWSSVGILPPGVSYVVALRDGNDPNAKPRLIWVNSNATAMYLPGEFRPALGGGSKVEWSVSVRRRVSRLFGQDEGVLLSPEGEWRVFTWSP
jgi:LysM repeat protein